MEPARGQPPFSGLRLIAAMAMRALGNHVQDGVARGAYLRRPMKPLLTLELVVCCAWVCGCLSGQADVSDTRGVIDQPCSADKDCAADEAECTEYAGALRCEADCADGASCGPHAECVGGECWRSCSSVDDCVDSTWSCRPLNTDAGMSSASYCVAPCSLYKCGYAGFTYTCGSGSSSASTDISYAGPEPVATTRVSYSNGHVVNCSGSPSAGECSDDSGATCDW